MKSLRRRLTPARGIVADMPLLDIGHDLRFSVRILARHWTYTLPATLTLALGIGATTAVFAVVDATLLRPLPFPTADRLVSLNVLMPGVNGPDSQFVVSELDRLLIERAANRVGGHARVLHPSHMYLLFKQFWSGHRPLGYLDSHTRHIRLAPPRLDLSALRLPPE